MSLTFLEAYTFMSESEDNVCLRENGDKYKCSKGNLKYLDNTTKNVSFWLNTSSPISSLNKSTWSKVEKPKVPETVELTLWGSMQHGKWFGQWYASTENPSTSWRKTDQTKTVTFINEE